MDGSLTLVTGAGTIGGEVVRQLAAAGHRVRALVRDPAKATFGPEVEVHTGDLSDAAALAPAFAGVDIALVVVNGPNHCPGSGRACRAGAAAASSASRSRFNGG
jgi:uncharacterized protein YbjT (DUF2867 family)